MIKNKTTNNMSDYLKAVLVTEDVLSKFEEDIPVYQSGCLTVQKFAYTFEHPRKSTGLPFDTTKNAILTVLLKVLGADEAKIFITLLGENSCHDFTFLFNASYDSERRVKDFDDAMRVSGKIVDVEENYETAVRGGNQQMLLTVRILVSAVTYAGLLSDKTLRISTV